MNPLHLSHTLTGAPNIILAEQMGTRYRSGFWVLIVLACLGLLGIGPAFADTRRPRNVQVALRAKWSGTPLLLEVGYVVIVTLRVLC